MLTCRICHCNCDPGDLRNGICDDCREDMEKEQERKETRKFMLATDGKQMEMEEMLI